MSAPTAAPESRPRLMQIFLLIIRSLCAVSGGPQCREHYASNRMAILIPPRYAPLIVASTSTPALISVPGGDLGIAVGTLTVTITFCCAPPASVNDEGTMVVHGTTCDGPAVSAMVATELVGFITGTTKVCDLPVLVWKPSTVCSPALL